MRPLFIVLAASLTGCALDSSTPVPYSVGQLWTAQDKSESVLISYRSVEGGTPEESTGLIGAAESCGTARSSAGKSTITSTFFSDLSFQVLGNTVAHHPLKPGQDGFNDIGVSVLNEVSYTDATVKSVQTTFNPDGRDPETTITTIGSSGGETISVYSGVAADEYVVRLFPLDLWSDWDAGEFGDGAANNEFEQSADGDRNFTLLTKHSPKKGDVWTSLNGLTFFQYDGTESANVGGNDETVDRVLSFVNGNIDPSAGSVLTDCLVVTDLVATNSVAPRGDVLTKSASLDDGCEGRFVHQQVGTERWFNNALVGFEGTQVIVTIKDFGWEYYDEQDSICTRLTDDVKPTDVGDAKLFVEYDVEVITSTYAVNSWTTVETE